MTPEQKIKHLIIARVAEYAEEPLPEVTAENVDDLYDELDEDSAYEAKAEIRSGEVETGLSCECSRHYESKSVAAKTPNGEWVGWTYWYGGGKHGEPEAIDWSEDAYDLACTEVMEPVLKFSKVEGAPQ